MCYVIEVVVLMFFVERKYFSMNIFIEGFCKLYEYVFFVLFGWDGDNKLNLEWYDVFL